MLKRGYFGAFHKILPKQVQRYIEKFADQHSMRDPDRAEPITGVAQDAQGKSRRYKNLIGNNWLNSRTRLGEGTLTLC